MFHLYFNPCEDLAFCIQQVLHCPTAESATDLSISYAEQKSVQTVAFAGKSDALRKVEASGSSSALIDTKRDQTETLEELFEPRMIRENEPLSETYAQADATMKSGFLNLRN